MATVLVYVAYCSSDLVVVQQPVVGMVIQNVLIQNSKGRICGCYRLTVEETLVICVARFIFS